MRYVVAAAVVLVVATGCGSSSRVAKSQPATRSKFADRIEVACLQRNSELRQLSRPHNKADFAGYIASMLNIVRYYRGQLAGLHPTVGNQHFARYRQLLRADEASAVALLMAVRRSNRRAAAKLAARQRDR